MMPMKISLFLGALAFAAAPARAQSGAVPSVTHAQYGVTYGPCVERPMPQPDGSVRFTTGDGDCGGEPVEPPVAQPAPQPQPKPDPCWWDDCPRGGGLIERYRIQKEAFHGGDLSGKVAALNALFDNMSAMPNHGATVFAGGTPGTHAAAAPSSMLGAREPASHRFARGVPSPAPLGAPARDTSTAVPLALGGTLLAGMFGLAAARRPRFLMAADRNNPQNDKDVADGFKKNHDDYCSQHPSSRACQPPEPKEKPSRDKDGDDLVNDSLGLSTGTVRTW